MSEAYLPYLTTLRRIPDEVILDMATREFQMFSARSCVCGWALRGGLSLLNGKTPDEFDVNGNPAAMAARFGGTDEEWRAIFIGVTAGCGTPGCGVCRAAGKLPDIELAFVHRVAEAASA